MLSGIVPVLYTAIQAIVERLPSVPTAALINELPLSFVDGITRAYLLCDLIPPVVVKHTSSVVSTSPWTLLLTSLVSPCLHFGKPDRLPPTLPISHHKTNVSGYKSQMTANAGFFFTGLISLHQPYSLSLSTPPELLPYGWTTTDLWCAPVITGLYALLTHAQPFWVDVHSAISGVLGGGSGVGQVVAMDRESARAVCAVVLAVMFSTRAVRNFGGSGVEVKKGEEKVNEKKVE